MKLGKLKHVMANVDDAHAEIYTMWNKMASIAEDLGKRDDYFMPNPDDWRTTPEESIEMDRFGLFWDNYESTAMSYDAALNHCGVNLAKHGETETVRKKYAKRKGPPMSAKNCSVGHKVKWDGVEYIVNKGNKWTKVKKSPAKKSPAKKSAAKKVTKIKPTFPKNAQKVVAAIYKMYDEMSSIAVDLGEKKDFFMRNPDTWMMSPGKMAKTGKYDMLYDEYLDTLSYYKEAQAAALKEKKSPVKAKKSPVKKASKAKKKTVAQLKKECKEQGLVYDAKTKKCRESKRKKKSPVKAKKSPVKKASKAKKKTVAQLKKECKEQGLVYDAKTKKCRESKRKKKSPAKSKKGRKVPGFFDAWDDVNPGYSKWDYGTGIEPEDEAITKYIKDTGKITGDILYVGSSYESRQEYGIVIVDLSRKRLFVNTEDFYYLNPSLVDDDEIIKELTQHNSLLKNSKKAVKEYIAWYKDSMMF
jgi:hypothetical protein